MQAFHRTWAKLCPRLEIRVPARSMHSPPPQHRRPPGRRPEPDPASTARRRKLVTWAIGAVGAACIVGAAALALAGGGASRTKSDAEPGSSKPSASGATTTSTSGTTTQATTPTAPTSGRAALRGRSIALDPGHNGQNLTREGRIGRTVRVGSLRVPCDEIGVFYSPPSQSGTSPISESQIALDVAKLVRDRLAEAGAEVHMTRRADTSWGPCVDKRLAVINAADLALSLHVAHGTSSARGFSVRIADSVSSGRGSDLAAQDRRLAVALARNWRDTTGLRPATSAGADGVLEDATRPLLAGSTVPIVELAMGNLRHEVDRTTLVDTADRERLADAIVDGLASYAASESG